MSYPSVRWRRKSGWLSLGGSGLEHASVEDVTTVEGRAAKSLNEIKKLIERFGPDVTKAMTKMLQEPPTGGRVDIREALPFMRVE